MQIIACESLDDAAIAHKLQDLHSPNQSARRREIRVNWCSHHLYWQCRVLRDFFVSCLDHTIGANYRSNRVASSSPQRTPIALHTINAQQPEKRNQFLSTLPTPATLHAGYFRTLWQRDQSPLYFAAAAAIAHNMQGLQCRLYTSSIHSCRSSTTHPAITLHSGHPPQAPAISCSQTKSLLNHTSNYNS